MVRSFIRILHTRANFKTINFVEWVSLKVQALLKLFTENLETARNTGKASKIIKTDHITMENGLKTKLMEKVPTSGKMAKNIKAIG